MRGFAVFNLEKDSEDPDWVENDSSKQLLIPTGAKSKRRKSTKNQTKKTIPKHLTHQFLEKNFKHIENEKSYFFPNDVVFVIFSFLPQTALYACSQVCTQWRTIAFYLENRWEKISTDNFSNFNKIIKISNMVKHLNISSLMDDNAPKRIRKTNLIKSIPKYFNKLEYLNMRGARNLKSSSLQEIMIQNPNLKWLNISGARNFNSNWVD